jgi:hypothetical protein
VLRANAIVIKSIVEGLKAHRDLPIQTQVYLKSQTVTQANLENPENPENPARTQTNNAPKTSVSGSYTAIGNLATSALQREASETLARLIIEQVVQNEAAQHNQQLPSRDRANTIKSPSEAIRAVVEGELQRVLGAADPGSSAKDNIVIEQSPAVQLQVLPQSYGKMTNVTDRDTANLYRSSASTSATADDVAASGTMRNDEKVPGMTLIASPSGEMFSEGENILVSLAAHAQVWHSISFMPYCLYFVVHSNRKGFLCSTVVFLLSSPAITWYPSKSSSSSGKSSSSSAISCAISMTARGVWMARLERRRSYYRCSAHVRLVQRVKLRIQLVSRFGPLYLCFTLLS